MSFLNRKEIDWKNLRFFFGRVALEQKISFKSKKIDQPSRPMAYPLLVEIFALFTTYPGTLVDW